MLARRKNGKRSTPEYRVKSDPFQILTAKPLVLLINEAKQRQRPEKKCVVFRGEKRKDIYGAQ